MKMTDIIKTASGNILQSKLRSFLTIIAVFIGAFTLTLTNGMGSGISSYIDDQVGSLGAKNVLVVQAKQESENPLSSDAPKKYDPTKITSSSGFGGPSLSVLGDQDIATIRQEANITSVDPQRTVVPSYIAGPNMEKYEVSVSPYITGTLLPMAAGTRPDNSSEDLQLSLPSHYLGSLGFADPEAAVGTQVTFGIAGLSGSISEVQAVIVGVQNKTLVGAGGANINTALNDRLYTLQNEGLPADSLGKYQAAIAYFDESLTPEQVTDLKDRLDKQGYTAQTFEDGIGVFKQVISGIVMVFNLFAIIALIAASFGVINTLLMAVQERTKEIGLMKAMGMSGGRIFALFSIEAVLLGFWGSFLGILAAIGAGTVANRVASTTFLKDFEGLNLVTYPWQSVGGIMLLIMVIAFLAGTLPAKRAAKLNPIDALRYE